MCTRFLYSLNTGTKVSRVTVRTKSGTGGQGLYTYRITQEKELKMEKG